MQIFQAPTVQEEKLNFSADRNNPPKLLQVMVGGK